MNPGLRGLPITKIPKEPFEMHSSIKVNNEKHNLLSTILEHLLLLFMLWHASENGLMLSEFSICNGGLLESLLKWNNSNASQINKQRQRMIQNILSRKQCASNHEKSLSL